MRQPEPAASETLLAETACCEIWLVERGDREAEVLKALRPSLRGRGGAEELLLREHRLLSQLALPGMVRSLGLAERAGAPALRLEYLPGGDLVPLAGMPKRHWIDAVSELCATLAGIHRAGVVHADIKARNVLFDASGHARLIDFGAAVASGAVLTGPGTAATRPPQGWLTDRRASPALDVWQLAVLLYELLSGRLPFGTEPGARSGLATLRPPLSAAGRSSAGSAALERAVLAVLESGTDGPANGRLSALADVIESVRLAEGRRS
jgi:serine/threonine protein kinase